METRMALMAGCGKAACFGPCRDKVCRSVTGRWYITVGHAGFNSFANNRSGYIGARAAIKASQRWEDKGRKVALSQSDSDGGA